MEPIDPKVREAMNGIAQAFDDVLPDGMGFALLVFDFGEGGRMNYISNANREDMLIAMKEFIAYSEGRRQREPKGAQ